MISHINLKNFKCFTDESFELARVLEDDDDEAGGGSLLPAQPNRRDW